jgi:hypothetical protein
MKKFPSNLVLFFGCVVLASKQLNAFEISDSLVNYYPFNSDTIDVLDEKDLYGGKNWVSISDRTGNNNSAISFKDGFLDMPIGTYITGDFTIMFWLRPKISKFDFKCIIEMSNLGENDLIDFVYIQKPNKPGEYTSRFDMQWGTNRYFVCQSEKTFKANKWIHLTFTLNNYIGTTYFNGESVKSCSSPYNVRRNITTKYNYVGKSSWSPNSNHAEFDMDDFKIFNRALSRRDIQFEMKNSFLD